MASKNFSLYLINFSIFLLICGLFWSLLDDQFLSFNNPIFSLLILFILSTLSGYVISSINGIPPLLGMLIAGLILRNTTTLNFVPAYSSILRSFSLGIIMLRAGLGLDPSILRKLLGSCVRLAILPCIVETFAITISSYYLLQFPLSWSIILGLVISSVSPAVVVPSMLILQEKKLGLEKGIHTLVIAAASIENVFIIAVFSFTLSIVYPNSQNSSWISLVQGFGSIIVGIVYGTLFGILLTFIPITEHVNCENQVDSIPGQLHRFVMLVLAGSFAIFGSIKINLNGAGALACVLMALIASSKWRKIGINKPIQDDMKQLWLICEPFLFGLIGTEMSLSYLEGNVGFMIMCLILGLIVRMIIASMVVWGANLNTKEKCFIALTWIPKATVQAAIGPMALDLARQRGDGTIIQITTQILTLAVISIIITAPIGALAISFFSSKLLQVDVHDENEHKNKATKSNNFEELAESIGETSQNLNKDQQIKYGIA